MKDKDGTVIYIGKAISLRQRVRSYFQKSAAVAPKVRILADQIADVEYIVTANEVEALILESNLIKEKSPKYNVRLKDDKHFPYLKITDEPFPRVTVVRRMDKDGRIFGPYTDAHAVRTTMNVLHKLFPLRTCSLDLSGELNHRPCLLYHIGRCGAPCAGLQTEEEYEKLIAEVTLFLEGRHEQIIPSIRQKMEAAAEQLQFEKAARLRDQMRALQRMVEKQTMISSAQEDQDVIGIAIEGTAVCVQLFFVRSGKLVGREHFFLDISAGEDAAEIVRVFAEQYYAKATFIPRYILLPTAIEQHEVVERWLTERRGTRVYIHAPQRGDKRQLVRMANENAGLVLRDHLTKADRRRKAHEAGLQQLQNELELPRLPQRIEAFDISNLHGSEAVGALVVLENGVPNPAEYRRFKIRTVQGIDDYAMMQEIVKRRFRRGLREQQELAELPVDKREEAKKSLRFASFPDLIVIDGGRGQLNAARETLRELKLHDIPVIGLAERLEEVYVQHAKEPIWLAAGSPGLHTLQRVRDEAHRFALNYHRRLRDRQTVRSLLDDVPGIGPKRKRALLRKFGSVKGVRQANLEQLQSVPGISKDLAERIQEHLG